MKTQHHMCSTLFMCIKVKNFVITKACQILPSTTKTLNCKLSSFNCAHFSSGRCFDYHRERCTSCFKFQGCERNIYLMCIKQKQIWSLKIRQYVLVQFCRNQSESLWWWPDTSDVNSKVCKPRTSHFIINKFVSKAVPTHQMINIITNIEQI